MAPTTSRGAASPRLKKSKNPEIQASRLRFEQERQRERDAKIKGWEKIRAEDVERGWQLERGPDLDDPFWDHVRRSSREAWGGWALDPEQMAESHKQYQQSRRLIDETNRAIREALEELRRLMSWCSVPGRLAILDLARDASIDDVNAAYRRLSMEHHPDRVGDPREFMLVKAA